MQIARWDLCRPVGAYDVMHRVTLSDLPDILRERESQRDRERKKESERSEEDRREEMMK